MCKKIISILLLLALLAGCGAPPPAPGPQPEEPPQVEPSPGQSEKPEAPAEPEEPAEPEPLPPPPEPEPVLPPDPRVETVSALLSTMTTEEKVGQLFFVRCPAEGGAQLAAQWHLGGLLLFGRDFKDTEGAWLTADAFTAKIQDFQDAVKVPLLIGTDEEGGSVARATRNPNLFPAKRQSPQRIFAKGGMEAVLEDTRAVSTGLLSYGINVNLAPVADISDDSGSFIYDRTFGGDAEATSDYIAQVVSVMDSCGIGSVLKHFPGYGGTADTHTGEAVDSRPMESFREKDLLPFAAGIAAGADAVLVSHNLIPAMDADLPASLSRPIHQLLREELGFNGVSITDDMDMGAVAKYVEDGSAAVLAIQAGNDMIITGDCAAQIPQVLSAAADGRITGEMLDQAVTRVLNWKYDLGLIAPQEA